MADRGTRLKGARLGGEQREERRGEKGRERLQGVGEKTSGRQRGEGRRATERGSVIAVAWVGVGARSLTVGAGQRNMSSPGGKPMSAEDGWYDNILGLTAAAEGSGRADVSSGWKAEQAEPQWRLPAKAEQVAKAVEHPRA
ncbi:hypothetical protein AMTR_s00074p00115500 [Amborella trichopoda]|uniref:Uncharacterized protein n=1 Tax=Amborella trichopoda TaxID=13333 RepID=W1NM20_AMBTC|nr:hypothetical protein AMTR_s00074p00115500 [Amborella trichopoda]